MLFSVQMGETETRINVVDTWDDRLVETHVLKDQVGQPWYNKQEAMKFISRYAHDAGWSNFQVEFAATS